MLFWRNSVNAKFHQKNRDVDRKNPMPVCEYCFNSNVNIPLSQGNYKANVKQQNEQSAKKKKRQLESAVAKGHHKKRKKEVVVYRVS